MRSILLRPSLITKTNDLPGVTVLRSAMQLQSLLICYANLCEARKRRNRKLGFINSLW